MSRTLAVRCVFGVSLLVLCACAPDLSAQVAAPGPATLVAVPDSPVRKLSGPVKCGEYPELSGDPSVLRDGNQLRMFCTGLDKAIKGGGIAQATSPDGIRWTTVPTGSAATGLGLVLRGRKGQWDHQLETANAIKFGNAYHLYYSGYPKVGWPKNPGQIGLATSTDGLVYTHAQATPVLAPTPNGYDANGLYSPVVFPFGNRLGMIYAGHNYKTTAVPAGFYLVGAVSDDGVRWEKLADPVLSPAQDPWFLRNGVAEADVLHGPDGLYYLLFTGALGDDEKRLIGVARSAAPFGPYEVRRTPLLEGTKGMFDHKGVLAPSVILDGATLRMWYLTSDGDKHMTGYAEIPWPLTGW